ncbi:DUF1206 domain-containing protein [Streptomyces sp. NPDC059597]|uniref:DUF1206 domain-containing protein n=1 Tax=Streptomyces sp. NPDC059597 TaxID=3346879 RepID=UPI0036B39197
MDSSVLTEGGWGQARRAADGPVMVAAAKAGFAARGLIYLLVGVIALQMALGGDSGGKQADRGGALAELAEKPFGAAMLWILGIALAGMALWRLSEAVFGAAGGDGHKASKRALSAARAVFYAFVCYSVLSYAAGDKGSGSGSSDKQSDDVTAMVLKWPGGQWIVGAAGLVVVGAGIYIAVRAVMRKFCKHLRTGEMSPTVRRTVEILGVGGGAARGIVFGVAGVFALIAAVQHEPGKAKGMDDTLRSFRDLPAGPWLLALIALGLAAFGVFSWCNARWREV